MAREECRWRQVRTPHICAACKVRAECPVVVVEYTPAASCRACETMQARLRQAGVAVWSTTWPLVPTTVYSTDGGAFDESTWLTASTRRRRLV